MYQHQDACIALINGKPASVRNRFQKVIALGATVSVSAVAAFELWYGVEKSAKKEIAKNAGPIRAALEAAGRPIGGYDLLTAGQAVGHKVTLVTANGKEFGRVKGLAWEDWSKS